MSLIRTTRRIALIAVAALLFSSTLFLSHGYGEGTRSHNEAQCNLCQQFSGSAGALVTPALVVLAAAALLQLILPFVQPVPTRRKVDSRLPRGPPAL